jgi:hypothetical protein
MFVTTPPSILQATRPSPHDFRPSAHVGSSHRFGTPANTGLMTPSSENTAGEREHLSSEEEIELMQAYVNHVSIWMDALGKDKHFANTVLFVAKKLPMLHDALLACGARHLALMGKLDNDKAVDYYETARSQLSHSLNKGDRNPGECALTSVVLNAYDVMTDRPTQRVDHIAATRALLRECDWNASSTGLGAACFWVNVGMEVLSCISFNLPTSWEPDKWGMDMEFTMAIGSRSGSRSVASSDDPWGSRAVRTTQSPMAMIDILDPSDEELWLHRIFYIMAKAGNFRANTPKYREPYPHDEQVRHTTRSKEWKHISDLHKAWNLTCPRSMQPYGYSEGPSSRSLFPNAW